jgi:hypothetical protein
MAACGECRRKWPPKGKDQIIKVHYLHSKFSSIKIYQISFRYVFSLMLFFYFFYYHPFVIQRIFSPYRFQNLSCMWILWAIHFINIRFKSLSLDFRFWHLHKTLTESL